DDHARDGRHDLPRAQREALHARLRDGEHGRASPRRVRAHPEVHRPLDGQEDQGAHRGAGGELMAKVSARLGGYRMSAQKVRLVVDQIRGRQVEEALGILATSSKRMARPLAKLVRSALANAEEKNAREKAGIDVDNLYVSRVFVDEGTSQWRIRAGAQGRADRIQRRASHGTV